MKVRSQSSSIRTTPSEGSLAERKKGGGWTCARALEELRALGERRNVDGMARFGIRAKVVYGVAKPKMDELARRIGKDHQLALELWASGVHDARILAGMIDLPREVSSQQMERWARDFDNWDVCDGTCCHLFVFAAQAWKKAIAWSRREPAFIKRAGFALMAYLAYRDKQAADAQFRRVLPLIEREAYDDRNFVRKAVNWALRNIGKRNLRLNREATRAAARIRRQDSPSARWIAADALRELKSAAVQARLRRRASAGQ
jgi:3-methyladenine DNA glycosylase AlkD